MLTVLLLVMWLASAWWITVFRLEPTGTLGVYGGHLLIGWDVPWSTFPVDCHWIPPMRHSLPFSWWSDGWGVTRAGVTDTGVDIPIWVIIVLVASPTFWLWRGDRRRQPGQCIKCGYDVRATTTGICPECGAVICSLSSVA